MGLSRQEKQGLISGSKIPIPFYGKDHGNSVAIIVPIFIGVAGFVVIVGTKILEPTNIIWLGNGDPATHYLGWQFFRNSPWTFPIGMNPAYGLELGNSITYSDSIPLLAFFFKLFTGVLPETFQYFGIWLLACFILQAWFGWRLVGLTTDSIPLRAIGSAFFALAPPMIWRLYGHDSLVGHFLILAALYLSLRTDSRRQAVAWGITLTVAALIHAYLLAMVLLLWIADILNRIVRRELAFPHASLEAAGLLTITAFFCWQAGYFAIGSGIESGGFGFYRMNILSPIDSDGWSLMLKDIPPAGKGEYEGFNFVGFGGLILAVLSLPVLISSKAGLKKILRAYPASICAMALLSLYAVSNVIGIGPWQFEFALPWWTHHILNVFRASGRMFWPVFYFILFMTFFLVIEGYGRRLATTLLAIALCVQILDTSPGYLQFRSRFNMEPSDRWSSKMRSSFWTAVAARYRNIRSIPVMNIAPNWQEIAAFAGRHGMGTNMIYLGRISGSALQQAQIHSMKAMESGVYDENSLYIIDDNYTAQAAATLNRRNDLLARIDGYTIVAPGWKTCSICPQDIPEITENELLPVIHMGKAVPLNSSSNGVSMLVSGWSNPEPWGTWSEGNKSTISFKLPANEQAKAVVLEAKPLISAIHPQQHVSAYVNGIKAAEFSLSSASASGLRIEIPQSVKADDRGDVLKIELGLPDAARPADIGINSDTRKLALGVISIVVE